MCHYSAIYVSVESTFRSVQYFLEIYLKWTLSSSSCFRKILPFSVDESEVCAFLYFILTVKYLEQSIIFRSTSRIRFILINLSFRAIMIVT